MLPRGSGAPVVTVYHSTLASGYRISSRFIPLSGVWRRGGVRVETKKLLLLAAQRVQPSEIYSVSHA